MIKRSLLIKSVRKLRQFRTLNVKINDLFHENFCQACQKSSVFRFLAQRKLIENTRARKNGFRETVGLSKLRSTCPDHCGRKKFSDKYYNNVFLGVYRKTSTLSDNFRTEVRKLHFTYGQEQLGEEILIEKKTNSSAFFWF